MKRLLLLLLVLFPCSLLAQSQSSSPVRGPQWVLSGFLQAQADGSSEAAGQFFTTPPRQDEMAQLASLLEGRVVEIEEIPNDLVEGSWILTPVLDLNGRPAGVIEFVRQRGQWFFADTTRIEVEAMAAAHRSRLAKTALWKEGELKGPPELATPRAALLTFLRAAQAGRWRDASLALDLQELPALSQPTEGRRLAAQLLAILNRVEIIPLSLMPNKPEGPAFRVIRLPGIGAIEMDRTTEGSWKVTPASIALFDQLWQEVRDRPILGGRRSVGEEEFDPSAGLRRAAPEALRRQFLGLGAWQWGIIGILLAASLALFFLGWHAARLALALMDRADPPLIGQSRRRQVTRSVGLGAAVVFLHQSKRWADLPAVPAGVLDVILNGLLAVSIVAALWAAWAAFADWMGATLEARNPRLKNLFVPVAYRVGQAIIAIAVLVYILRQLGVDPSALVAGLGLGGLVLGLAAKDTVENFIGSALILFERPFQVGDWIKIGDAEGIVEDITLRSTRIRTFTDTIVTLPNSRIVTGQLENLTKRRKIRARMLLQLPSTSQPEQLEALVQDIQQLVSSKEKVLEDGQVVKTHDLTAYGPQILVVFFMEPMPFAEELELKQSFIVEAMRLAEKRGLKLGVQN